MRIVYLQLGPPSNEWEGEGDGGSLYWMLGEEKKRQKKDRNMKNTFSSRPPPSSSNLCPHCAGILIRVCVWGHVFICSWGPNDRNISQFRPCGDIWLIPVSFFLNKTYKSPNFSFPVTEVKSSKLSMEGPDKDTKTNLCVCACACVFSFVCFFFFSFLIYEHKQFSSHKSVTWSQQCLRASVIVMGTLTGTVEIFRRADR